MEEITTSTVEEVNNAAERNFDLTSYARAKDKMIATSERSCSAMRDSYYHRISKNKQYTPEEIQDIIDHGSLEAQ
jgi:hypothetical protein